MPSPHILAIGLAVLLAAVAWLIFALVRRVFKDSREAQSATTDASPRVENSAAFMTASMQGVIRKLREQEKELERLHRVEKERAEHTERLSEEVTRNMPAGLLMVNAQGIVASANPAAEQVLGVRGLGYRRYSEVLGESSELTQLVGQCLAEGKIFRREQVDHKTPAGETRRLGVTISPVRRGDEKISGAICLLSDLTELAALQEQMELKKNFAALGELSAGIAHEFKNALATISGYAQMIRSESAEGEISDHAERILEQTRNITHVVTEFLKFARPLDISDEPVELQPLIDRALDEISGAAPGVTVRAEGDFGIVAGDEGLLRQVILNLARNGAEACEGRTDGRVVGSRRNCEERRCAVATHHRARQRLGNFGGCDAKFISSVFHDESAWNRVRVGGRSENYFAARRFDRSKEPPVRWCSLYRYATRSPSPGE